MELLKPNWHVPDNIRAFSSTRVGGHSEGQYQGLNLGMHVQDEPVVVEHNRQALAQNAGWSHQPVWLNQTHSTHICRVDSLPDSVLDGDGSVTRKSGIVCAVMTADCLPVLMTDVLGSQVAAVHAGWRGLCDGILEQAVNLFEHPVIAWIGPAISQAAFEVGEEVYEQFMLHSPLAQQAFIKGNMGKYFADLPMLAEQRLKSCGVEDIYHSNLCTFNDERRFYSYRRDGITGRQASFIWIEN